MLVRQRSATPLRLFFCETHYRKATVGYGGVAGQQSNMVPQSSPRSLQPRFLACQSLCKLFVASVRPI
jgi:hypothetical protein